MNSKKIREFVLLEKSTPRKFSDRRVTQEQITICMRVINIILLSSPNSLVSIKTLRGNK